MHVEASFPETWWNTSPGCTPSTRHSASSTPRRSTVYALLVSLPTVLLCSPARRVSSCLLISCWSKMPASRQTIIVPFYRNVVYYKLHKAMDNQYEYKNRYSKRQRFARVECD